MKNLWLGLLALLALVAPAEAQTFTGKYYASPPTYSIEGAGVYPLVDANGRLITASPGPSANNALGPVSPGTVAGKSSLEGCQYVAAGITLTDGQQAACQFDAVGGQKVSGTVAAGAADAGNPVKTGGVYNSTLPTLTTGQRGDSQVNASGELRSVLTGRSQTPADANSNTSFEIVGVRSGTDTSVGKLGTITYIYNGTTWDRLRAEAGTTGFMGVGGSVASGAADAGNPVKVGGRYNSSLPTLTNGQRGDLQLTANGETLVSLSGAGSSLATPFSGADAGSNSQVGLATYTRSIIFNGTTWDRQRAEAGTTGFMGVGGSVASAATDAGNPVKVGGVFNTIMPTFTNGQRGDLQLSNFGGVMVASRGLATDGMTNASMGLITTGGAGSGSAGVPLGTFNFAFNGTSWDRQFTCPNSAVVNVTAASTTQLVALSASTVIRVCSFVLTESLAGTAKFVYGTGSNCGTGTTDITGAMALATSGTLSASSGNGSLFRGLAANALCLTAVTGNITGFVSYAQY